MMFPSCSSCPDLARPWLRLEQSLSKSHPALRACQEEKIRRFFRRQVLCFGKTLPEGSVRPRAAAADAPARKAEDACLGPASSPWAADTQPRPIRTASQPQKARKPASSSGWRDLPATRCCRRYPTPARRPGEKAAWLVSTEEANASGMVAPRQSLPRQALKKRCFWRGVLIWAITSAR